MRSGLVLVAVAASLAACAREEQVKNERPQQIDLVEPSEAPFELDEKVDPASEGNCVANGCNTKSDH